MKVLLALCVLGCSSSNHSVQPTVVVKMTPVPLVEATHPVDEIESLGVERLQIVRFTKTTVLYKQPDFAADDVGTIRKDARAAVLEEAAATAGCKTRWIHIAPRGWACDVSTEPTSEPPTKPHAYALTDDDPTPPVSGVYGVVRGKDRVAYDTLDDAKSGNGRALVGNNSVRAAGSVTIDGVRYWRTTSGDLIDASQIATFSPSKFRGTVIDGVAMPTWVRGHDKPREPVAVRADASKHAKITGKLAARTIVTIFDERDGFARVGDDAWIERRDLRATTLMDPPEGTAENEKWFDIDLDEQTLVAYEGTKPVYATMVSTGKWKHPTPVLIARVQSKLERTTMASDKQDVYSVADVPWTMFYDGNYALHTSYWHDGFGSVQSHGCINLSPFDARLLFRWSSPDVPPGWIAVRGDEDHPGSLVRVRSKRLAEPEFRGYAKRLHETDAVATR
jgi:hypothetical protein